MPTKCSWSVCSDWHVKISPVTELGPLHEGILLPLMWEWPASEMHMAVAGNDRDDDVDDVVDVVDDVDDKYDDDDDEDVDDDDDDDDDGDWWW